MAKKSLEQRVDDLEERLSNLHSLVDTIQFDLERVPPKVYAKRKGLKPFA
jgi:hypothetical protein